jgi:hypothetical protein
MITERGGSKHASSHAVVSVVTARSDGAVDTTRPAAGPSRPEWHTTSPADSGPWEGVVKSWQRQQHGVHTAGDASGDPLATHHWCMGSNVLETQGKRQLSEPVSDRPVLLGHLWPLSWHHLLIAIDG